MVLRTLFVYLLLFVVMMYGATQASKTRKWQYIYIAVFFYAIIFGIRYGVGADHISYYEGYLNGFNREREIEVGYTFLEKLFNTLHMPPEIFFSILCFVQLLLLLLPHKNNPHIYPYIVFAIIIGVAWLSFMNIIRQATAFSIIAYGLTFALNKKFVPYLMTVVIASLFHRSAILLLFIYPLIIYRKGWFKNIKLELLLLLGALIIMQVGIVDKYADSLLTVFQIIGYDSYGTNELFEKLVLGEEAETQWGPGTILLFMLDVFVICCSNYVKKESNNAYITRIYDFIFISILISYAFRGSLILQRPFTYFGMFKCIFYAYALYVLLRQVKYRIYGVFLAGVLFMYFVAIMYKMDVNASAYYTVWQKQEYRIEHAGY